MKEIGLKLKQERERQGYSLEEVAEKIKISESKLIAIESGDLTKLPSRSYLRGFIQTYAKCLHMDQDSLLLEFDQTILKEGDDSLVTKSQSKVSAVTTQDPKAFKKMSLRAVLILLGLSLLGMIIFFKNKMDSYKKESQPIQTQNPLPQPIVQPQKEPTLQPKVEEPKPLPKEKKEIPALPKEPIKKPESEKPQVENKKEEPPKVTKPKVVKKNYVIIIDALDSVAIEFEFDNKAKKSLQLSPGGQHILKAQKKLKLTVSNGGLVNITINDNDKGVMGEFGEPMTLELP